MHIIREHIQYHFSFFDDCVYLGKYLVFDGDDVFFSYYEVEFSAESYLVIKIVEELFSFIVQGCISALYFPRVPR